MNSTKLEGFPEIGNEQYAVLAVESATGIVHSVRGERFVGHGERFLVFDTLSLALEYCRAKADSDAAMETTIFDCHGAIVDSIRPQTVHAVSRKVTTKKPWWRWW